MKLSKTLVSALLTIFPLSGLAQDDFTPPTGFSLVWEDNFDGTALDENNWNIEVNGNGGGNQELQYYRRENVAVQDGNLVLTARRETYLGKSFTSGRVTTQNKAAFKHGLLHARIKFPSTKDGLWPAYWMMGNDMKKVGWPRCGEMDIVELGHANGIADGTQDRYFGGTLHFGPSSSTEGHQQRAQEYTVPEDMAPITDGNYHDILVYWDGDIIEMYYDLTMKEWEESNPSVMGKKTFFTLEVPESTDNYAPGMYFHKPFFFLFNLAIGGWYTGITDPAKITALPNMGDEAKMYVDFVKVYQDAGDDDAQYRYVKADGDVEANYEEEKEPDPLPDNTTPLSGFATKALDEDGVSTFDFDNVEKAVLISTSDGVRGHLYDAVGSENLVDLNVDNTNRFLDLWGLDWIEGRPSIYEASAQTGEINSFGWGEGYTKYTIVNPVTWAGQAFRFETGDDISMIDDTYWLHFALRGADQDVHSSARVSIGNAEFWIGPSDDGKLTTLGDFKRDGEWYYFDIPIKALKGLANPLFNGDVANFTGAFMTFGSSNIAGAELCYDNIFLYTKREGEIPTYSDSDTDLGKYGYKTLDDEGNFVKKNLFTVGSVKNVIPLALDQTTWETFTGNGAYGNENLVVSADNDYTQGNDYWVWGDQTLVNTIEQMKNAFGQEVWSNGVKGMPVWKDSPSATWNGMGAAVPEGGVTKDLSMIDNSYYLHIELRSDAALAHLPITVGIGAKDGNVKLVFGKYSTKPIFADFGRDGKWYAFDIPVSELTKYGTIPTEVAPAEYTYTISTGDTQYTGAGFSIGNIFFYQTDGEMVEVNPLGEWTTKSLDDAGQTYFDFAGKDFINITGNGSVTAMMGSGNIIATYSPDVDGTALNIWSSEWTGTPTLIAGTKSAEVPDSFGGDEGWIDLVPNYVEGWSGFGIINEMGVDFSYLEDGDWHLHFAMRGTTESNIGIDFGNAAFTIGKSSYGGAMVLGDYERDGEWYSFDIPYSELKKLATKVFTGSMSNYKGNFLAFHTNDQPESEIQIDNIFLWRMKNTVCDIKQPVVNPGVDPCTFGIYDICGRKVTSVTRPGLYIVRDAEGVRRVLIK
ncbi:MAG: glycoside hydrolase family 16 protein [Bacteroidales bacterium]|nr:glycoside hydrolase family 16 protein [Bacteroidales bacterium]